MDVVIQRLDKLDEKLDHVDRKIDRGLEKLNDKIDKGLERLNSKIDRGFEAINNRFDRLYYLLFGFMTTLIASLLALLAKVMGVF